MIEAEKGSLGFAIHVSFAMGEFKVTPANARHPKCRECRLGSRETAWIYVDLEHGNCPSAAHRIVNTHIMSILCNATQFKPQCHISDPDEARFPCANPKHGPAARASPPAGPSAQGAS